MVMTWHHPTPFDTHWAILKKRVSLKMAKFEIIFCFGLISKSLRFTYIKINTKIKIKIEQIPCLFGFDFLNKYIVRIFYLIF